MTADRQPRRKWLEHPHRFERVPERERRRLGGLVVLSRSRCVADGLEGGSRRGSERCEWFIVRKEAKGRGASRLVEGARIGEGDGVLLIDDIVTTAGSILKAYESVQATGALVVAAVRLADRGGDARRSFDERGVPYFPTAIYQDVGIPAIGTETASAGSTSRRQVGMSSDVD